MLTRFNPNTHEPDDFDILIHPHDFNKYIKLLNSRGYQSSSHDYALGGRIAGIQVNLVRSNRIKIDLHQDFTWRKKRYLDVEKIWLNSSNNRVSSTWDAFLVMVNVIFEKTYFMQEDFEIFFSQWQNIKDSPELVQQTIQYGWNNTFLAFKNWMEIQIWNKKFPVFLPIQLVLFSYLEKFEIVSLAYYLFFRIRYAVNKNLPYDKKS